MTNTLRAEIGRKQRRERVYVPGSDHTEALAAVVQAIDTARREKDLGLYDGDDGGHFARSERLTQRRRELEAVPVTGQVPPRGYNSRGIRRIRFCYATN